MSIIDLKISRNTKGEIGTSISDYQESDTAKDIRKIVLKDFGLGAQTMQKSYQEFNTKSVLTRQNIDQKAFNSNQEESDPDPDKAWKSKAIRPVTRNKIVSIAAHVLASVIFPNIFAQNENQEEDKEAARVMRMLIEWVSDNYDYSKALVYAVIAALVNPAAIVHFEFAEVYKKCKEIQEDGSWTTKEKLDDILSGFQFNCVPLDELYIGDIYIHNIQKQPYLIWRKAIDYDTAKIKYKDKKNFKYVQPGIQVLFDEASAQFYEQYDENLRERLVEEVIYYNRIEDLELVYLNGVLVTAEDEPNKRQDKKYPFGKLIYELIDEGKFFYGKSLAFKMAPDQEIINNLYQMVIDGSYLKLMPPTAVYGDEQFNSSVVTPGAITVMSPNSKLEKIDVGTDINAGLATINEVEKSMNETSSDPRQAGQGSSGQQTAFEVSRLEENARTMLGLFAKPIGWFVKDLGELMVDSILQFMTVPDIDEITGGLKYKNFLLGGDDKSKSVQFDEGMGEMTEEERLMNSYEILKEQGGLKGKKEISKVNPSVFRKLKFLIKISPDNLIPPSEAIKKALNLELYDRAVANPLSNQEEIYKTLLLGSYETTKNDPDKYIQEQQMQQPQGVSGSPLSGLLGANSQAPKAMQMKTS